MDSPLVILLIITVFFAVFYTILSIFIRAYAEIKTDFFYRYKSDNDNDSPLSKI